MVRSPLPPRRLAVRAAGAAVLVALSCLAARGEDPVAVLVNGPLAAKVGDRVAFEVELVNRSGRPLEKLRVIDYFDKGFHHEASASPIEQKGTIDLAAGTSRRLTLDFLLDEPGRQCHRVEILDQSHTFLGGATACVQVAANTVAAPVAAPAPPPPPTTAYPATTYPPTAAPVPTAPLAPPPVAMAAPLAPPPAVPTLAPPPAVTAPVLPPIAPSPVAAPVMAAPTIPAPVAAAVPAVVAPAAVVATNSATAAAVPPATPSLELDLTGPAEVPAGGVAEFVTTVRNTGAVASGPTTLEIGWEDAFAPQEASDGFNLLSSKVSWSLPSIEPGAQVRRQINLKAHGGTAGLRDPATGRSCVRAVLAGQVGGTMVADESCIVIHSTSPRLRTPREAGLRVTLADCDDPVLAGSPTTLVCTVVNAGTTPSGRVDLTILLPERSTLVGDPTPSRVRIDGTSVTFDSLASIPPGGQTSVELAYRMPASGTGRATALLRGAELEGSAESNCQTTFLAP